MGSVCRSSTCVHSLCSQSVNGVGDELNAVCQTVKTVSIVSMVSRRGRGLRILLKTVRETQRMLVWSHVSFPFMVLLPQKKEVTTNMAFVYFACCLFIDSVNTNTK